MVNGVADCYTLSNGVEIPCIGFGTWLTPNDEVGLNSLREALACGYRHIDTAAYYGNEPSVGRAVRESGVRREELFVTTKLWNDDHGYQPALSAFQLSLERLGLDYVDLYMVHWPNPLKFRDSFEETHAATWKAMEEIYRSGRARSIGISNYLPHHIDALEKTATIMPQVHQIRLFPGYELHQVIDYSRERDMQIQAYSPLGRGALLQEELFLPMTERYGKSPAQICLRWSLQKGYLPLPKSVSPERIRANTDIFDFHLSDQDMGILNSMENVWTDGADPDTVEL